MNVALSGARLLASSSAAGGALPGRRIPKSRPANGGPEILEERFLQLKDFLSPCLSRFGHVDNSDLLRYVL